MMQAALVLTTCVFLGGLLSELARARDRAEIEKLHRKDVEPILQRPYGHVFRDRPDV